MEIKALRVGTYQANCYIVQIDNDVLVIDPGAEFDKIEKLLKGHTVVGILITHNHFDHIGAIEPIQKLYGVNVYDFNNLEEKQYELGKFKFQVIKTPGHTSDSITFYFKEEKVMFTGDFLFKGTIGRTDMPTASHDDMIKSLRKIRNYDDDILIFPGHEDSSTLGIEKSSNRYLNI